MTMHKSMTCLVMTGMLWQGAAVAAGPEMYAGLGVGQSMIDVSGSDLDALAAADGLATTTTVDDNDTAWKIFGGYRVTENIAVEAGYMDYGTITADSIVTAPVAGSIDIDLDITAWHFDVVGILPLNDQFEMFARLGLAIWDVDGSYSAVAGGLGFSGSTDDDGSDFHLGLGASYALMDNFSLRAEWERVNTDDDLDAWTLSAQVGF